MDKEKRSVRSKALYFDPAQELTSMRMPIQMTGRHASMMHDPVTQILPSAIGRGIADSFIHLKRSLLVRLKLSRHSGESVSILCGSEDMGRNGMNIMLPCKLGLIPGTTLEMELYLNKDQDPVAVKGRVCKSVRSDNGDSIRYIVEVEFCRLSGLVEKEIAAFIHSSTMDDCRQLPA